MTPKMAMSVRVNPSEKDYGVLGNLVRNMYDFLQGNKNKETIINDHINGKDVSAKEYFREIKESFEVERQRLPSDLTVKAAYIKKIGENADRPILELSEIDFKSLEERLAKDYGDAVRVKGKSIFSDDSKLMQTITSGKYKRTVVIYTPELEEAYNIDLALQTTNSMWEGNTFREDPKLMEKVGKILGKYKAEKPSLRLLQIQEMRQIIEDEQVAKLVTRLEQRISPQMVLNSKILSMPTPKLIEKVVNETEDVAHIEGFIANVLRKRAIAKIKNSMPGLSWSQATNIYHKLGKKYGGKD